MTNPEKSHEEKVLEALPRQLARAERLRQKGELDQAARECTQYMAGHFDDFASLYEFALIMMDADRMGIAQPILKRAAQLEPNVVDVWNALGSCYREGANLEEAETHYFRALKLEPDNATAHSNLSQLYNNMGQPNLSLKHANRAIDSDPGIAEAFYNRSLANLLLGKWREGWADFDACLGDPRIRKERVYGMLPRWNGTEGKTLIAYGEQGIGDEIAFACCIPDLCKKNKVILECQPRLKGLFQRSFDLETHGTRHDEGVNWLHDAKTGHLRKIDAASALGSLPQYYRNEDADFAGKPYLIADPLRRIQWKAALDAISPKLKVGIAWTGGNNNTGKARRSVSLDDMLPILRQDATFISLQYMDAPEVNAMKRDHGIDVYHFPHAVQTQDYDDTAALVAELDLVICVQTAVAHLSGALGQNCWVMVPKTPRWFYGISGTTMPWYESVRLYRQKFKWVDLIAEIAVDLRNRINPPVKSVH